MGPLHFLSCRSVRRTRLANAVQHLNNQQTLRACTALQGAKQRLTVNPSASPVYVDKGLPNASQFADIFTGAGLAASQ